LIKTLLQPKKPVIKQGLPVEKKTLTTAAFISALFIMAIAEAGFVKSVQANPYMYYDSVSPPTDATPLIISVSLPKNNTIYRVNNIDLNFSITTENTSLHYLLDAYFKADWMQDNVTVYKQHIRSPEFPEFWDCSGTFRDIPDGEYYIVITARGGGGYAKGLTYYFFDMTTISVITFTVDTTAPKTSILSPLNGTFTSPDTPLNFTVSEPYSEVSYVLDNQENVTVAGNTTMAGLPYGVHNVTMYSLDAAGNVGASETIIFTVLEPPKQFPTTMTIAPIASVAIMGVGFVVYYKKRKNGGERKHA
jgi:hypothetical protein